MFVLKIIEEYDGRLPSFNVVREVNFCGNIKSQIVKTFDSYEEAEKFCNEVLKNNNDIDDRTTPCGEENPCVDNI